MMRDPRGRLLKLLGRLGAEDLAAQLRSVRDVGDLAPEVRGAIVDVLGHEATERGVGRDGTVNRYGVELEALVDALSLDDA